MQIDGNRFWQSFPLYLCLLSILYLLVTWSSLGVALVAVCVLNAASIPLVKRIARQARPRDAQRSACEDAGMGVTARGDVWGMPSGHTQVATSICALLAFVVWSQMIPGSRHGSARRYALTFVTLPILVLIPIGVAIQRVRTSCHSVAQVSIGALAGLVLAGAVATAMPLTRH